MSTKLTLNDLNEVIEKNQYIEVISRVYIKAQLFKTCGIKPYMRNGRPNHYPSRVVKITCSSNSKVVFVGALNSEDVITDILYECQ